MPFTSNEKRLLVFTSEAHAVSDSWHLLYPSLLFLIARDFDNDYLFLGLLVNVMAASVGVSGVLAGFLSDRYSSRLLFAAFGVLCCLGCLAVAVSTDRTSTLLGLMLLGLGTGIYHPVGLSAITRNVSRRAMGLGIHGLTGAIGMSILPVGAISIGVAFGWKTSFAVGAAVSISVLALLPLVPVEFDRPVGRSAGPLFDVKAIARSLMRQPMTALYGIAVLRQFSVIGFFTFLTTAIVAYTGLGEERVAGLSTTGLFVTFVIAVGGAGSFLGGRLGERFPPEGVLIVFTIAAVPALLLLGPAKGAMLMALVTVVSLAHNAAEPQIGVLLSRFLPAGMHGKGFAVLYGAAQIIGSVAGLLVGAIAESYGVNWAFPVIGVVLLCSVPLMWLFLWPRRVLKDVATPVG